MYLARLIYTSYPTEVFKPHDIEDILRKSRQNNGERGVSGLLFFNRSYFLQCLEGSRSAINDVYHRIMNDSRHKEPLILEYKEIWQREFSAWEMGYLPENEVTQQLYKRYSPTGDFSPYHMSGESCHQLMVSLRQYVKAV